MWKPFQALRKFGNLFENNQQFFQFVVHRLKKTISHSSQVEYWIKIAYICFNIPNKCGCSYQQNIPVHC